MKKYSDYHGIVVDLSLKKRSVLSQLEVLSIRSVVPGVLKLYKIVVQDEDFSSTIQLLQNNLRSSMFYTHLYREDELIVVFKSRVMYAAPNPASWAEIISYGRSLHIPAFWLDFKPCRLEDEQF